LLRKNYELFAQLKCGHLDRNSVRRIGEQTHDLALESVVEVTDHAIVHE